MRGAAGTLHLHCGPTRGRLQKKLGSALCVSSGGNALAGIPQDEGTTIASRARATPSGDVRRGGPPFVPVRLVVDLVQPVLCRAQGHFFGYPLKRKNNPPRSNTLAMGQSMAGIPSQVRQFSALGEGQ